MQNEVFKETQMPTGRKPDESLVAFLVRFYLDRAFPELTHSDQHCESNADPSRQLDSHSDSPDDPKSLQQPAGNVYKFPDSRSRR